MSKTKKGNTNPRSSKPKKVVRERVREHLSRPRDQFNERANVSMRPPGKQNTSGKGGSGGQSSGGSKPEASTGGSQGGKSSKK